MARALSIALIGSFILLSRCYAQEVNVGQEAKPKKPKAEVAAKTEIHAEKAIPVSSEKAKVTDKQTSSAPATGAKDHKQPAVASEPTKKVAPSTVSEAAAKTSTATAQVHKDPKTALLSKKDAPPAESAKKASADSAVKAVSATAPAHKEKETAALAKKDTPPAAETVKKPGADSVVKTVSATTQAHKEKETAALAKKDTPPAAESVKKGSAESTVKAAAAPARNHKEQKAPQVAKKDATSAQKVVSAKVDDAPPKQEAVAAQPPKGAATKVAKAESVTDKPQKQTVAAKTAKTENVAVKKTTPASPAPESVKPELAVSQPAASDVPKEKKSGHSWLRALAGTPDHPSPKSDVKAAVSPALPAPEVKPPAATAPVDKKTTDVRNAPTLAVPFNGPPHKDAPIPAKSAAIQNPVVESAATQPAITTNFDTAFTKLADGFDYPVGKPDAQGYYKARGFRSHGHLGEDWDGVRGGDTDLGDPIYSIGDGMVVFARDCHMGWGNVVIVRHSYREGGIVKNVDALYGHLNTMLVRRGQAVGRGQKIATMGTAHGLYDAHLHLEIRKNIEIGMSRAAFARDFSNYYDPSQFIQAHRHLQTGGGNYRVAMNTFTRDSNIKWDKVRNYSHAHTGGGTSESSAALKKAVADKH